VLDEMKILRRCLWRVACLAKYRCGMGVARKSPRIQPVRRSSVLDEYAGQWVAVKDGQVIAHGRNSRDVVRQMRQMGPAAEGAVLQRAPEPTEALAVGLG
jgi:Family of unknown function (DUF5678)